ncbi:MAG: hypothetical protein QME42_01960, partial [bacterium]|nr:hypothetical protein [bacterium]
SFFEQTMNSKRNLIYDPGWGWEWILGVMNAQETAEIIARVEVAGSFTTRQEDEANLVGTKTLAVVNLARNQTESIPADIKLPDYLTGKLYLVSSLYSQTNQLITQKITPFYINRANISLNLKTNKKTYKAGDKVNIEVDVKNMGTSTLDDLILKLENGTATIYESNSFSLAPGATNKFTTQVIATKSFILSARVIKSDVLISEMAETIDVITPTLDVDIEVEEPVRKGTQTFNLVLKNDGKGEMVVNSKWQIGSSSNWNEFGTVTIPPGTTKRLPGQLSIIDDSAININCSGDINGNWVKYVEFGEMVDIKVMPEDVYPVGYLEVPFEVVNTGELDSEFVATWTISTAETQRALRNNPLTPFSQGESLPVWCKAMPKIILTTKTQRHEGNPQLTQIIEKIPANPSKSISKESIQNPKSKI